MKTIIPTIHLKEGQNYLVHYYNDVHLDYPVHYHSGEYELCLHLGCSGTRIIGDHISNFTILDVVFIAPGLPHCWHEHYSEGERQEENAKVIVINFNRQFIGEDLLNSNDFIKIKSLFKHASRGLEIRGESKEYVKNKMLKLRETEGIQQYIHILEIINYVANCNEWGPISSPAYTHPVRKSAHNDAFEEVHQYILDNYKRKIKISEVAAIVSLSESAFSHYFKKRTFKSFSQFVNELRVGYASRLLIETDKTISEAAFDSGFNNLSNFNRIFKKIKACSPKVYREKSKFDTKRILG